MASRKSQSPVLALCRKLIDAGHDPATALEVYRGDTLALRVGSIGQAARLKIGSSGSGTPIFVYADGAVIASPVRQNEETATILRVGCGAPSPSEPWS
jgi:hypothetical protein